MTSSARTRIDCGKVRPSAFAALRLMTSSNVVGCSTLPGELAAHQGQAGHVAAGPR
jgi:hypothetical protein